MQTDRKKNILIVDDDPFMQSLYRKALEREGFNILTAIDGLAAVEMLPTLSAELIVLDLMLPKIHGLKVLEAIRAHSLHKNLPVLILSNAYLPEVAQKAMKAQATSGILKSECSPKRLVKIIRETLDAAPAKVEKQPAAANSWFSSFLGGKNGNSEPSPVTVAANPASEAAVLTEVQNDLLKSWPSDVSMIREHCLKYVKSVGSQDAEDFLKNLYRRLRLISARATMGEYTRISQLTNALEAMLFEHGFNLKRSMSPSVIQTMVQAVDCLEHMFKSGRTSATPDARKIRILLVDDDPVCNMVNELALKRANFDTVCANDGVAALSLLESSAFDLILLDINMPVLSGFEVCEKIRKLPINSNIPVIFVTLHNDFQSRAQSILSGSNAFIAKPISPLELIVKALVFLLRSQENDNGKEKSAVPKPAPDKKAAAPQRMVTPVAANTSAPQTVPVDSAQNEERIKELQATQSAVEERVKSLTEALAAETKRREEAEQQAADNVQLQNKLENAQAENLKAQDWFQHMLDESNQQIQSGEVKDQWKLDGRARALASVRDFVEEKVRKLSKSIEVQTVQSEMAKQKAAEFNKRKDELETALAAIQQAKENLLRDLENAGSGQQRGELEAALAENQKSQANLLQKIEETRKEFQVETPEPANGAPDIESLKNELEAARRELTELKKQLAEVSEQARALGEQVRTHGESLAAEQDRRSSAEQQAAELVARRAELEKELEKQTVTQAKLLAELAEHQQSLETQVQTHNDEMANVSQRAGELENTRRDLSELKAQHALVSEQVSTLRESLAAESGRRSSAEQQAAELVSRRTELEQELSQRTRTQEELRGQLAGQQQHFDAQVQTHNVELGNLSARSSELESTQHALTELKTQYAAVTAQVQTLNEQVQKLSDLAQKLSESLTAESGNRAKAEQQAAEMAARHAELEQELSRRARTQEELHAQLAEQQQRLAAEVQTHTADLGALSNKAGDLENAQRALAELKTQHVEVSEQVRTLGERLQAESGRRAGAEQQAAELISRRTELEQELSRHTRTQEELRAQLAEQQQRLDAEVQTHTAEVGTLSEKARELENARLAWAELKTQHADATERVRTLGERLEAETGRRASAEHQTAELVARRTELEQELSRRTRAQEELRTQLAEHQQRLETEVQTHTANASTWSEKARELESAQHALAELKAQHADASEKVRTLGERLQTEAGLRASAEHQAAELTARRAELEQELSQRTRTQEELRTKLADQQQRFDSEVQLRQIELGDLAARTLELEAVRNELAELKSAHSNATGQLQSVNEQVQILSKRLSEETGRRTTAEQQITGLHARRAELEQELAQHTNTREELRSRLAEQQQQLNAEVQNHGIHLGNLAERTRELETTRSSLALLQSQHADVSTQVQSLTESLAAESGRRTRAEQQAAELGSRHTGLEQELARHTQTQTQLRAELADYQQRLDAEKKSRQTDLGNLTTKTTELDSAQRTLAGLQAQHAEVSETVRSLTDRLQTESGRRESVELQLTESVVRRTKLEQELAQRVLTQAQLRAELAAQQQRLDAEVQTHRADLAAMAEKTGELEVAHRSLAELQTQHSIVTGQVRSLTHQVQDLTDKAQTLTQSLAAESVRRSNAEQQAAELVARRTELEQQLTQHTQTQAHLRADLSERQRQLDAQIQAHQVGLAQLTEKTRELETANRSLAELKRQHADVNEQVLALNKKSLSLTESLAAESGRRTNAEQQVGQLVALRTELEQQITRHTQSLTQLRAELSERQLQLDVQVQVHQVELGRLAEKNRELDAANCSLAELKAQHAGVSEQLRTQSEKTMALTESLSAEIRRRTDAEQQSAELIARRTELEQQLAEHLNTQAQLRTELSSLQQRLHTLSAELEDSRRQAGVAALNQQRLVGQLNESEKARAELAQHLGAARELIAAREASIRSLEIEIEKRRGEYQRLDLMLQTEVEHRRRLEIQLESVQSQLDETTRHLALKCAAEQAWLGRESELQGTLRSQQDDLARSTAAMALQEVELGKTRAKAEELELLQSALLKKVQNLTGQAQSLTDSLTAESHRRGDAEQKVTELTLRRAELEQDIARHTQAQAQLRAELSDKQQLLDAQIQKHNVEIGNLAVRTRELEAARSALAELKSRHENAVGQVQSLNESLAAESSRRATAEQVWIGRESELQGSIRLLQDDLAKSGATLAIRECDIQNARKEIAELLVLQSALCAKVKDLAAQGESAAQLIKELQAKIDSAENDIVDGHKQSAGLRYAILDASRMNLRLHRERTQKERQNLDAMRQLVSSLAQTPLSLAQRGILADLQNSMEVLKTGRAAAPKHAAYPIDLPGFRGGEFSFTEITESAFRTVRSAAEAAGVAVTVSSASSAPGNLIGFAEHLQQLITLLAVSPVTLVTGVNALDLQVAVKPISDRTAGMTLRLVFSTDNDPQDLLLRLNSVATSSTTPQAGSFNEAELGLAAGWQLAHSMGAQIALEVDGGACLRLALPLEMASQLSPVEAPANYVPSLNGNGHGQLNGHHHRNRNGQFLNVSHAGTHS